MLKIKQTSRYPANIKYSVFLIDGDTETLYSMYNNLDEAIEKVAKVLFPNLEDKIVQDILRFHEILCRTGFYFNNDFKQTDFHSPNPKITYRQAMELRQRLLEYCQGDLKFPPIQIKYMNQFLDNVFELSLNLKVVK